MGTSGPAWLDRRRRGVALGVAGAVVAFLALTMVQAAGVNPYLPPDELYHVSYALVVRDGRLPELTTPVPAERTRQWRLSRTAAAASTMLRRAATTSS